jgi:ABC-type multidrug transport system fused ATPase/permease subunit
MSSAIWRRYAARYRSSSQILFVCILVSVARAGLAVPVPLLVRYVFDHAINEHQAWTLVAAGAAILLLQVVNGAAGLWTRYVVLQRTKLVIRDLRSHALAKLYAVSRRFLDTADPGVIHDRIVHETERVDVMTNAVLDEIFPSLILALGVSGVLLYLDWRLFLVTVTLGPLLLGVGRLLGRLLRVRIDVYHRSFERFSHGVMFVLSAMDLTRLQAAETWELGRQREKLEELRCTSATMAWLSSAFAVLHQTVVAGVIMVVLVVGGVAVSRGAMTLGSLVSFFAGLVLLRGPVNLLLGSLPRVIEGAHSLCELYALLDESSTDPYTGTRALDFKGAAALEGVTFGYDGQAVLRNVSLTLRPGTVTALVGANGSGKTTIVSLILGFYRPWQGRLLADGMPYDELNLRDLRRQIGVVTQTPLLIPGTVRSNITYGVPEATFEEVREAGRLATVDRFVSTLGEGYESEVGERGVLLSGGQCQRVAIARALLCRPRLLVLDEPTNHLDEACMRELLGNLRSLEGSPTVLVISNLPEVQRYADEVFRLESGVLRRVEPAVDVLGREDPACPL